MLSKLSCHLRLLVAFILSTLVLACGSPLMADDLHIRPSGPTQTLYNWSSQKCEDAFIPDAPARAFRRGDGETVLIATHKENWSLVGDDLASVRPSCGSLLRSSSVSKDGGESYWIEGTYTFDGRVVYALVSEDRTKITEAQGCASGSHPGQCWVNNILAALSEDGGRHFRLLAPVRRTVASMGNDYGKNTVGRIGVFTATNIVHQDNYFYSIMYVAGGDYKDGGNCLFRSNDVSDPTAWRGWDGEAFSAVVEPEAEASRCAFIGSGVLRHEVRSLTFDTKDKLWIAVFSDRLQLAGDAKPVPGFYYSTSTDLVHWGRSDRIMESPLVARTDSADTLTIYPSLIDPESKSRNFDTIDSGHAWLFYTLHHLKNGAGTLNRDLVYVPVSITR